MTRLARRLRRILDVTATCLTIIVAIALLGVLGRVWQQSAATAQPVGQSAEIPPPQAPQPLDGAPRIGSATARIGVIEYSDFECPFCGRFAQEIWPEVKKAYIVPGKVQFAFRNMPLAMHQHARDAAVAAHCAAQQQRFWDMHDLLFQNQSHLTSEIFGRLATTLHLDSDAFDECRASTAQGVIEDAKSARALGISGTPTFLLGTVQPNRSLKVQQVLTGAQPFQRFKLVLDDMLRRGA